MIQLRALMCFCSPLSSVVAPFAKMYLKGQYRQMFFFIVERLARRLLRI